MPFMVGQILCLGIPSGDAQSGEADIGIPADKVDSIIKVVPIGTAVTGFFLVPLPGAVQYLGIAEGRRATWAGNKPKESFSGWFGVMGEFGLLMDDGKLDVYGQFPLFLNLAHTVIPAIFIGKDGAGVVDIAGA